MQLLLPWHWAENLPLVPASPFPHSIEVSCSPLPHLQSPAHPHSDTMSDLQKKACVKTPSFKKPFVKYQFPFDVGICSFNEYLLRYIRLDQFPRFLFSSLFTGYLSLFFFLQYPRFLLPGLARQPCVVSPGLVYLIEHGLYSQYYLPSLVNVCSWGFLFKCIHCDFSFLFSRIITQPSLGPEADLLNKYFCTRIR